MATPVFIVTAIEGLGDRDVSVRAEQGVFRGTGSCQMIDEKRWLCRFALDGNVVVDPSVVDQVDLFSEHTRLALAAPELENPQAEN